MASESPYSDALARFEGQTLVTVCCGATCAFLGDERNLREFLIADETARRLRDAGHVVMSLLIDDSLDPLDYRQLRVAANKDETIIEQWAEWCGKPIAHIPDPWDCHASYAAHFEDALMERLGGLGCRLNLVSTASLYEGGIYTPFVRRVLEQYDEIMAFINERFVGYQPETLFWVLCPKCGCIDQTKIEKVAGQHITYHCAHCDESASIPLDEVRGKLNWKLDCAVRWVLFNIDAEPFGKAYLEPQAGSFAVAQEISKRFFGGHDVLPLRYGQVQMPKSMSYRLFASLPGGVLRTMLTERATSDITMTPQYVMNLASRCRVEEGLSYLDCVKQLIPMWLLRPQCLTEHQRDLVAHGVTFAGEFLEKDIAVKLPTREQMEDIHPDLLGVMHGLLVDLVRLREVAGNDYQAFCEPAKRLIGDLGFQKQEVTGHLRAIVGQEQGVPVSRMLFLVPVNYLETLEYMLHLRLSAVRDSYPYITKLAA